jgi:hypothetical protein
LEFPLPLLVGGLVGGLFVAASNIVLYGWIMPAVNASQPPDQAITPFMVNFKLFAVLDQHATIAPKSKLRGITWLLFGLGVFCSFAGWFFTVATAKSGR